MDELERWLVEHADEIPRGEDGNIVPLYED
jgi:hypothetical protein